MGFLENIMWVVHILVALAICGVVLLQHGKGADMGAAFGSGASGSIFGAAGSANFLSRATAALATVFFITSLGLTYYSAQRSGSTIGGSIMDRAVQTQPLEQPTETRPAQPADVPLAPLDSVAPDASDIPVAPTTLAPQENSAGETTPNP
jgi:preprotein translocase subunit SecG